MPRFILAPVPAAPRHRHTHVAAERRAAEVPSAPTAAAELLRGPGWFDSSWDLRTGLEVREGLPEDVRLEEWLDAFCAQPGLDAEGAAASARRIVSPSSITASA